MAKDTDLEPAHDQEHRTQEDLWLRCVACGHSLAPASARVDVEGKHEHTFVNPGGHEFTIRCFREAPGCNGAGAEETFWSWFRGFAWRIALCGGCGTHVGWSYRGEASSFWGLIARKIA
jgi:hypothetical protein